ncbi:bifunctional tRNA (5-methylaminomethyl-2-thiouridine)(34)-methyltransferase MnmD/FAD-dependent 5-carboxymethylaminomethyl-2-thiouridine(34) oxidoreductase MnmC [Campylobacter sp. RM9328]|uniref:bifunctional tRNA (5-methylaminomethyl-2-thiouridine)(34)-methyltransferase MnmD/FAD-dependent 5-carboxymethylaminomethyl-2-thiouridine(34) oxidoreductase MnmC n=1 Tax=Campylobacter sp. RM9328 TaxID=1705720 RepID=UPI001473BA42|nr:bifunctional tRNA (5-methylaminomethyl-2-thiouridine)(34)-methyltransferase MnmD/FAD-dependent 5-carboxymethylaminomethyl-2-thiouridine(34) oxidoreductase MnmC [Campylobacter sp. RM9328]
MKTAIINFKDKIAFNEEFNDIYFNTSDPLGESKYVFASAIDEIFEDQNSFIVAELGFGAGLNFLTLCNKFKNTDKKLHFVSIEMTPISPNDLQEIYKKLNAFKLLSKKLISLYPPIISGIHRIEFSPNITLDLCFGEAKEILPELDFEADVWFMDGFAPSKNSSMWDEEIFKEVARLSKIEAVIKTYSCAKIVRENFIKSGFELTLLKGYGKKRQMSHAVLKHKTQSSVNPWFQRAKTTNLSKNSHAIIVGAGIAGLATAYELSKNGIRVTLMEKENSVATNGSGNISGALIPLITKPEVNLGRMHLNAFLQAVRFYKNTLSKQEINFTGCIEYAYDELLKRRYESRFSDDSKGIFDYDESAKPYPALLIKDGAHVCPIKACKKLAKEFEVLLSHKYLSHKHLKNGKISIKFKHDKKTKSIKADFLIFAAGSESTEIFGDKDITISSVRGQVTHIEKILNNTMPLSALGYICPAKNNIQIIGATYARGDIDPNPRADDDNENLNKLSDFIDIKNTRIISQKVGFRSYSADRFPIIGALHDEEYYKSVYKDLFWTKHKANNALPKYEQNVFVNFAHGSRGLGTAILGAKLIGDLVLNRPLCIEKSLFNDLHPARFLVRKLKRAKI